MRIGEVSHDFIRTLLTEHAVLLGITRRVREAHDLERVALHRQYLLGQHIQVLLGLHRQDGAVDRERHRDRLENRVVVERRHALVGLLGLLHRHVRQHRKLVDLAGQRSVLLLGELDLLLVLRHSILDGDEPVGHGLSGPHFLRRDADLLCPEVAVGVSTSLDLRDDASDEFAKLVPLGLGDGLAVDLDLYAFVQHDLRLDGHLVLENEPVLGATRDDTADLVALAGLEPLRRRSGSRVLRTTGIRVGGHDGGRTRNKDKCDEYRESGFWCIHDG